MKKLIIAALLSCSMSAFAAPQYVVVQNVGKEALQVEADFIKDSKPAFVVDIAAGEQSTPMLVDHDTHYLLIHLPGWGTQRIACPIKSNAAVKACYDTSGEQLCNGYNFYCN